MTSPNDSNHQSNYHLPSRYGKALQPLSDDLKHTPSSPPTPVNHQSDSVSGGTDNPALSFLRQKINTLYQQEPSAEQELKEATAPGRSLSKHQQYILELSTSGKSLAEIQTAWHNYYVGLSNQEKHEVWQEFYDNYGSAAYVSPKPVQERFVQSSAGTAHPSQAGLTASPAVSRTSDRDNRTASEVKDQLLQTVRKRAVKAKGGHGKSLLFGLSLGVIVTGILMFGFFNERFIAPFITPSRSVSSTPLIIDPESAVASPEPKIIIPKINVDIPVVYDEPSIEEAAIQRALERGVIHYPITSQPGELGNAAIFGHSSNNILNKGKYKFAFVLLRELEPGDTFMVQKDRTRYVYRVFDKKIVEPSDVSVLDPINGKAATMSLITCDPPGTALKRLVVVGEQISPDPKANVASSANVDRHAASIQQLPSDAPTLWERISEWLAG